VCLWGGVVLWGGEVCQVCPVAVCGCGMVGGSGL
jgi:hypothetical protein